MLSSGFTDAPVTRGLVFGLIASSILVSVLDIKYFFYIQVDPHLWSYGQWWRSLIYQTCYTNSGEVLFAAIIIYHLRGVERMWGGRKFGSFLVIMYILTSIIPPLILTLVLRPLSGNTLNYLPAGANPLIFSILAQFHAAIPHVYRYKLATSDIDAPPEQVTGLTFSDKSFTYALALQLSLVQFPGSLLGAVVGWVAGYMYRNEILPQAMIDWRVPAWMVGAVEQAPWRGSGEDYESLRRRLEGENATATTASAATGSDGRAAGNAGGRTIMRRVFDQFRDSRGGEAVA